MQGFLYEVARDLYARNGGDVSALSILFPSRRARLFFTDVLAQITEKPIWQPEWITVDDLMHEASGLKTGDRLRLITELFKIYQGYHPNEKFDKFYFWGEMLLTDFDTIDKYLIDASQLFRNISDIKELESDISYMTPAQLQILAFWKSVGDQDHKLSEMKENFLEVWKSLIGVYNDFRARLMQLGMAYNGMVQRAAVERIRSGEFRFSKSRHYVIAGFNALSACEKALFKFLAATAETDFYWDYDTYYKGNPAQEAGMFVRTNLAMFPPRSELSHDNMCRPKQITSVATVSNAVQCKYAARIVQQLAQLGPLDKDTAIVLTDENLLLPLLYALPESAGKINVTMGYPLKQSLAYSFVERLLELQNHRRTKGQGYTFYHTDVEGILMHPYLAECDTQTTEQLLADIAQNRRISVDAAMLGRNDLLRKIFAEAKEWRELSHYLIEVLDSVSRNPYQGDDVRQRMEFLTVIMEHVGKLHNSLEACNIEVESEIYNTLLRRHLQTLRIPFEGEPLEGIQVMGILETRNLDFRNVIILSMSDDNFPRSVTSQASFVPYNLRSAFELPTPEHHEGVYAYYFYRLIQRAERLYMLYCSHADEKSTGEPSRYIYQLDFESGFPIHKLEVGVDVNLAVTAPITVAKDAGVMERLYRFVDPESKATLSPTAFFRYVACPLRFYFYSVAGLRSEDTLSEEVDAPMFGTILHAAVQRLYTPLLQVEHPATILRQLIDSDAVVGAVTEAIAAEYMPSAKMAVDEYPGNLLLVKEIVMRYLRAGIMPYDLAHDNFMLAGLEEKIAYAFDFQIPDGTILQLKFAGIADRIDSLDDGRLRVVDYKTGAAQLEFGGLEALFNGEAKQRQSAVFQTFLYAMMLSHARNRDTVPTLYYVRAINNPDYSPQLVELIPLGGRKYERKMVEHYADYAAQFEELVRTKLVEIYDPTIPFTQCAEEMAGDTCKYCDFNEICKRQSVTTK